MATCSSGLPHPRRVRILDLRLFSSALTVVLAGLQPCPRVSEMIFVPSLIAALPFQARWLHARVFQVRRENWSSNRRPGIARTALARHATLAGFPPKCARPLG